MSVLPRQVPKRVPQASEDPRPNDTVRVWALCGFLLLAVGVIYGQTLRFPLLGYDDHLFVTGSPEVQAGLTGRSIAWAFTNGPMGEWYPLSMMSHMLDCQMFGLNAWGHHLTNLLLHAATAIGLFLVLRSMTGEFWASVLSSRLCSPFIRSMSKASPGSPSGATC